MKAMNISKQFIAVIVILLALIAPNFALAAPGVTKPVPGAAPPAGANPAPTGTKPTTTATPPAGTTPKPAATSTPALSGCTVPTSSSNIDKAASTSELGTVKGDDLLKLPLNERIRCDTTIKTMWRTMLNLADVLVALFFLVVAFATILHINYDTYGVKKALPPLLIGIVLAHFSLPIVYSIVDFAQIMSAGFYNSASGNGGATGLAQNISTALFTGGVAAAGPEGAVTFTVAFDMILFLGIASGGTLLPMIFLAAFVIFILATTIPSILIVILSFLLYARFYIILFLTIVAPLAWLTQAWGPVQGFFKKWWGQFTMWTFMAPVVVFFLWIAIRFSQASMNAGTANFGTYVITLVMFYLAITTPFKMGGQIMAAWGGLGKKASALGYKGVNTAGGAGLDRLGAIKTKGGKTVGELTGIRSFASYKEGIKGRFEERTKRDRAINTAAVKYGDYRPVNPLSAESWKKKWTGPSVLENNAGYRGEIRQEVKKRYGEHGISARQLQADIDSGSMTNREHVKELILMAAERGEDTNGSRDSYKTKFKEDLRANSNFDKRHDAAAYRTNPALIQDEAMRRQAFNSMSNIDVANGSQMYRVGNVNNDDGDIDKIIAELVKIQNDLAADTTRKHTLANGVELDNTQAQTTVMSEILRMKDAKTNNQTVAKTVISIGKGLDIAPLADLLNRYNQTMADTVTQRGTGYAQDFLTQIKAIKMTMDPAILAQAFPSIANMP